MDLGSCLHGAPTKYEGFDVNECGFIQRRVVTGFKRDDDRIERPSVITSLSVEYIPPALLTN